MAAVEHTFHGTWEVSRSKKEKASFFISVVKRFLYSLFQCLNIFKYLLLIFFLFKYF